MRFISRFTASHAFRRPDGRAGGTRTPNRRFWRPVLYQLSYCPSPARAPVTASAAMGAEQPGYHRPRRASEAPNALPGPSRRPVTGGRRPPRRTAAGGSAGLFVQGVLAVPAAELGEL